MCVHWHYTGLLCFLSFLKDNHLSTIQIKIYGWTIFQYQLFFFCFLLSNLFKINIFIYSYEFRYVICAYNLESLTLHRPTCRTLASGRFVILCQLQTIDLLGFSYFHRGISLHRQIHKGSNPIPFHFSRSLSSCTNRLDPYGCGIWIS